MDKKFLHKNRKDTIYHSTRFWSTSFTLEVSLQRVTEFRLASVSFDPLNCRIVIPSLFKTYGKHFGVNEQAILEWLLDRGSLSEHKEKILSLHSEGKLHTCYAEESDSIKSKLVSGEEVSRLNETIVRQSQSIREKDEQIKRLHKQNESLALALVEKEEAAKRLQLRVDYYENLLKSTLQSMQSLAESAIQQKKHLQFSLNQFWDTNNPLNLSTNPLNLSTLSSLTSPTPPSLPSSLLPPVSSQKKKQDKYSQLIDFLNSRKPFVQQKNSNNNGGKQKKKLINHFFPVLTFLEFFFWNFRASD